MRAPDGITLAGTWGMFLASIQSIDLWAFVALSLLWAFLLASAFFLYRWLWSHDAEKSEDFHLGL